MRARAYSNVIDSAIDPGSGSGKVITKSHCPDPDHRDQTDRTDNKPSIWPTENLRNRARIAGETPAPPRGSDRRNLNKSRRTPYPSRDRIQRIQVVSPGHWPGYLSGGPCPPTADPPSIVRRTRKRCSEDNRH